MVLVIAGDRSGVGKTTVTIALLASLCRRGRSVQSFKVGPDYIDPMFHQSVTGRPCRNLDPVLTSPEYVRFCFAQHAPRADCALIEGVMGLFDGASGTEDWASTAHVARLLEVPVLLVLDCSRLSRSIAAIVHGYQSFDPRVKLAGVVLNRVGSDRHLELLQDALASINVPILGQLRRQADITIPDRHLGLVPSAELEQLHCTIDILAKLGDTSFNWDKLLPLLAAPPRQNPIHPFLPPREESPNAQIRLALARDRAFSFYYADNLDVLEQLGVELVSWSPMADPQLPENVQGLYFGGGFPEVFAQELADNVPGRLAVKRAIQAGMPTYAECGGLMYLCQQIVDFEGKSQDMVGVLPAVAVMGKRLSLGYRQAVALQESPLLAAGTTVWGHEFHRSQLTKSSDTPLFQARGYSRHYSPQMEGWCLYQLHASYIHLHWGASGEIPARFVRHCTEFAGLG